MTGNPPPSFSFAADPHPDGAAQGQAALLLVESLIHALVDAGALSKGQAIQAIEDALEVKDESGCKGKEPEAVRRKSIMLLENMLRSLHAHDRGAAPDTHMS